MNTIEVNEEAFKGHSDANHSLKFSDEAEKSFKSNSNQSEEDKVNLYTGYFSSEYLTPTNSSGSIPDFFSSAGISSRPDLIYNPYDQSYFSVNQNQTESSLLQSNTEGLSRSFGFYSSEFSSSNCLHDQRPEEKEVFQMNPTCQTGFYEQYDQTKTECRNQILANIWRDWEANTEDFSPSIQSGFWVDNTYYQRWSTNSGTT